MCIYMCVYVYVCGVVELRHEVRSPHKKGRADDKNFNSKFTDGMKYLSKKKDNLCGLARQKYCACVIGYLSIIQADFLR